MDNDDLQREMERYLAHFNRAAKRPTILFARNAQPTPVWTPALDMYETEASIVVLLDLAGVDAAQTEVHAEPRLLVVRGVRRERHGTNEQRNYHALEVPYGRFERTIHLPPDLDTSRAQASYRDGLLEITLPKRVSRHVPIGRRADADRP